VFLSDILRLENNL